MFDDPSHEEMEEERRLCYVAMTRARKRLALTAARERTIFGQTRRKPRSIFLRDVPDDLLMDVTPRREAVQRLGISGMSGGYSGGMSGGFSVGTPGGFRPRVQSSLSMGPLPKKPPGNDTWVDADFDQRSPGEMLQPGAQVRHSRYGVGKVVRLDYGDRLKVEVDFPGYGRKTIIAEYLELG